MIDYKFYKVFSQIMAKRLLKKGYTIKDIEQNINKPDKIVFVFIVEGNFLNDMNQIHQDMKEFKRKKWQSITYQKTM